MFVLQALCSNYTMVLVATALMAAALVRPEPWQRGSGRLWLALAATGVVVALALLPFLLPYYRIRAEQHMARSIDEVQLYSATWRDYLTTAGRMHFKLWAEGFFGDRTSLFPGVAGLLLTLGTVVDRARLARRPRAHGAGVRHRRLRALVRHVPARIRLAARARAAAAGHSRRRTMGVARADRHCRCWPASRSLMLQQRWRRFSWWPAVAVALVGIVTLEAMRAPLSLVRFEGISTVHARLNSADVRAIVVFPLYGGEQFQRNSRYLLDQTRHWRPMLNGYSSFAPNRFFERAARLQSFPDAAAIQELRSIGISHVVVHRKPFVQRFGPPAVEATAIQSGPRVRLRRGRCDRLQDQTEVTRAT